MEDGIYRVNKNSLMRYMVVKHYGDVEKKRYINNPTTKVVGL